MQALALYYLLALALALALARVLMQQEHIFQN